MARFELRSVEPKEAPNSIEIRWAFFDPGYTVRITTIAVAEKPPYPQLSGQYHGIDLTRGTLKKPEESKNQTLGSQIGFRGWGIIVGIFITLIGLVATFLKYFKPEFSWSESFSAALGYVFSTMVVGFIAVGILAIAYLLVTQVNIPYIQ